MGHCCLLSCPELCGGSRTRILEDGPEETGRTRETKRLLGPPGTSPGDPCQGENDGPPSRQILRIGARCSLVCAGTARVDAGPARRLEHGGGLEISRPIRRCPTADLRRVSDVVLQSPDVERGYGLEKPPEGEGPHLFGVDERLDGAHDPG